MSNSILADARPSLSSFTSVTDEEAGDINDEKAGEGDESDESDENEDDEEKEDEEEEGNKDEEDDENEEVDLMSDRNVVFVSSNLLTPLRE